ncbi:hypothetical protein B9K06_12955 [Bacillus sp. OG2]|nr:hypothetical protein B9K06_12955 [Bacillus sp. OG2]
MKKIGFLNKWISKLGVMRYLRRGIEIAFSKPAIFRQIFSKYLNVFAGLFWGTVELYLHSLNNNLRLGFFRKRRFKVPQQPEISFTV